jgi:hypothetical protein
MGFFMLWGVIYEGFRFQQYFYFVAFIQLCIIIALHRKSAVSISVFVFFLVISIIQNSIYGESNFKGINIIGPYQVGHKDMYCSRDGVAVSVYYPMDRTEYNKVIN